MRDEVVKEVLLQEVWLLGVLQALRSALRLVSGL